MRPGLTIGEFAQLTHLSIRTLRRYHEGGLLTPQRVDPASGYRYYTSAQIPAAQVIARLRELDLPLRDIGDILATPDPDTRASLVAGHLRRLEAELDRTRAAVSSLRRLLNPRPDRPRVEFRTAPATVVAAVRGEVARDDVLAWYDAAMAELDAALRGQKPTGPPGGVYDNDLFTVGRGGMVVYRPVADPPSIGRAQPFTLPAAELAVTVHHGSHDDIDVTYGELGAYVTDHALAVAGGVRETYLVGPRDDPDPGSWRTEIGWPVFRLSPH